MMLQYDEDSQRGRNVDEDEAQLKRQIGRLLSVTLDRSRPLWMVYDIQGFSDGSSVLFIMIHVPDTLISYLGDNMLTFPYDPALHR